MTIVEERFYGYKHWTLEDPPRCFNVGKGLRGRPRDRRRNHKWHAIVKRYGLRVEVCIGPVTNEEACAWEIQNIEKEGTFSTDHSYDSSDIGCNFTRGGDHGTLGHVKSEESRKKISIGWTDERRRIASERMRSSKNPMKNKETAHRVTKKLAKFWTGCEWTDERREKASQAKLGERNPNFGKPQPEEIKQKNREANRKRALERSQRRKQEQ